MSEISAYLHQFDDAWGHAFESLSAVLTGVTEEEAFDQAPCYADEERESGWPSPGTIAWQVAHVTHCKRHYTDICLRVGEPGRPEAEPWMPVEALAELLEGLAAAHTTQRAAMAAITDEQLDLIAGNDMPFREFLSMTIRHDTWHAAQIAVARRLYRGQS